MLCPWAVLYVTCLSFPCMWRDCTCTQAAMCIYSPTCLLLFSLTKTSSASSIVRFINSSNPCSRYTTRLSALPMDNIGHLQWWYLQYASCLAHRATPGHEISIQSKKIVVPGLHQRYRLRYTYILQVSEDEVLWLDSVKKIQGRCVLIRIFFYTKAFLYTDMELCSTKRIRWAEPSPSGLFEHGTPSPTTFTSLQRLWSILLARGWKRRTSVYCFRNVCIAP